MSSTDELLAQLEGIARQLSSEQVTFLIGRLAQAQSERDAASITDVASTLRERAKALVQECEFRPGQLVQWKPGLRNKLLPDYGAPAIVLEVLDEPVVNINEPADSPYFRERLDLALGALDASGDFVCFHFDGRRFEAAE